MKKGLWLIGYIMLAAFSMQAQDNAVLFSANGGFYEDVFELELFSSYPQGRIFYTTNGNLPTVQSQLYTSPLVMDTNMYSHSDIYTIQISPEDLIYIPDSIQHCIVIRAAVFDDNDSCVSEVNTQSYFIRALGCDTHGLAVISLCADTLDLFDYTTGIMVPGLCFDSLNPYSTGNYYMHGREWERPVNVEFYEANTSQGLNQAAGLRTHGNRARRQPQKGLKIYARKEYGKKRFNYHFFETTPINSFKHLVIKPFSTLWPFTGVQDYFCGQLAISLGLEAGHSRPVVLYLNGEYWGVYFLQEKMDEHYLEDHFNVDADDCNIIANWNEVECGSGGSFFEMMSWLETTDLSVEENYNRLCELVDVENFADYMLLETFVANYDWPANNVRCWQEEDSKWRWMFYDGDATLNDQGVDPLGNPIELDVFGNATYVGEYTWPSSTEATLLFRKLLDNPDFYDYFSSQMLTLCQGPFSYEQTLPILERVIGWLQPEMEPQSARFGNPFDAAYWQWACTLNDDFLAHRVDTYLYEWGSFTDFVPEQSSETLSCYPNPTNGPLHIAFESKGQGTNEIALYDLLGQKVYSQTLNTRNEVVEATLYLPIAPGIYVLKVNGFAQRIVKY